MPINTMVAILVVIPIVGVATYLIVLLIRVLKKYLSSKDVRKEKRVVAKSLGDAIRKCRIDHKMTQEFVAEALGVSRQAVSKWESGASDPSTSNLMALAKLFGISAEDLLISIQNDGETK